MRAAAGKRAYGSHLRYTSTTVLVLIGLLAVAWASAGGANAATTTAAGASGKQSTQGQVAQARPGLAAPLIGDSAGQAHTGPDPSTSPHNGKGAGLHSGLDLKSGLQMLTSQSGRQGSGDEGTGGAGVAPAAIASPTCAPEWSVVSTANDEFGGSILVAVTSIDPDDVWAGGYYGSDAATPEELPFFEHWDGTAWTVKAAALPAGAVSGQIWDLSANSSNDIWAVGFYSDGTNTFELIERWDGIQWNAVAGAQPSTTDNELLGVAAVSTSNVWAVGYYSMGTLEKTLIEQWDGSTWSQITSPNQGTGNNDLQDISVVPGSSGSDIWAVGLYKPTPAAKEQTLSLQYDGTNWNYVASLNVGADDNLFNGVQAISANNVWAVGGYAAGSMTHTLAEHWNGSAWTISATVDPDPTADVLYRLFATGSDDVWAAGLTEAGGTTPKQLIEHWNGTAWSVSLNTAVGNASVTWGIGGTSSGDIWAAGGYLATASPSAPAQTLAEHYTGTHWAQVYSPNAPGNANLLYSVSANSATDIWAVGLARGYLGGTSTYHAVIEHWNGSSWSLTTSPHPGGDQLYAVKAVSANDVWAVGNYANATNDQTLILHWNGTTWSQVTSPNPGGSSHDNDLLGVDAASASDAWAVGNYYGGTTVRDLILHWNGSAWLSVSSPSPGAYANYLSSVTVVPGSGGSDAWAAGYYKDTAGATYSSLLERWNGTSWSVVASPNVAGTNNELKSTFALSANDVWAAGETVSGPLSTHNLALHWDGASWSISPVVQQGPNANQLGGVTATASNDVYVVGGYYNASILPQALIEHWNGSTWSVVPSVPSPGTASVLYGIIAVSSSNMWAVGAYIPTGFHQAATMAQHFFPCLASCSISFSDVPVGSTFYPYIHCLACIGIVNGYADGTFKPNANVTRGQLSKIVANSAGFFDPQTTQMFQDVPISSTFQVYIGRLASRGYISGYTCGGAGEPCVPPGNLPYFRPNANATRGQISKIVSNAAGFSDTPSGQQFQDVAVGSTYYTYIYRLVVRSVMGGYACGGAGEPCVPPGNLPYFRPNNNATRGQTSKIVANTFYPECSSPGLLKP